MNRCFNAPLEWKRKCSFHHLSISSGILWNSHKTKFDGWLFHQMLLMNDWHYDNCGWRLLITHLLNVMLWWQQNAPNSILFQLKTLSFLINVHWSKGKLIQVLNDQIMCFWNWHTFDFSVMVSHNAGCVENESDHWSINTSQVWLFIYCLLFVYSSAGIAGIIHT